MFTFLFVLLLDLIMKLKSSICPSVGAEALKVESYLVKQFKLFDKTDGSNGIDLLVDSLLDRRFI